MTQVSASFSRDANGIPIGTDGIIVSKTRAYTGAAGLGAQGASTLFTVTGDVIVNVFAVCTENLAGATATIEIGISGNTAALIAQTTATEIDLGEVWVDNAPATVEALPGAKILTNGTDIIETIATADITDGTVIFYCAWRPLSQDSNLVAA